MRFVRFALPRRDPVCVVPRTIQRNRFNDARESDDKERHFTPLIIGGSDGGRGGGGVGWK